MSLYDTPATSETSADDLSSYYASPTDQGVRIGWDKFATFKNGTQPAVTLHKVDQKRNPDFFRE